MHCLGESCTLFVIFLLTAVSFTHGGNVLVLPGEYSHWHNMRNILEELLNRNHSVTVLQERFPFLVFDVPLKAHEVHSVSEQLINIWMQYPTPSMVTIGLQIVDVLGKVNEFQRTVCDSMLRNDSLIARLRDLKFDVLFYDPMVICSDLLAEILDLPLRMCGQMPSPPSYVPVPPTRVKNMIIYVVYSVGFRMASMSSDNYYSEILGKDSRKGSRMFFSSHEHLYRLLWKG
ncbi:hypothetical protein PO909_025111 [Leuciscus waleckii]